MKINRIAWLLVVTFAVLAVPVAKAQAPKTAIIVAAYDGGAPLPPQSPNPHAR
jgi:hypothetical protein